MSDYGAYDQPQPRRYKTHRTRPRERDDPDYVEETTYIERGKGPPPRDLVFRPREREREDSIEDIPRDFPPPDARPPRGYDRGGYDDPGSKPSRRARSAVGRRDRDYDDEEDYAGAGAVAGGAAGYAAGRARGGRRSERGGGRRDPRRDPGYYSDEDYSPPRRREKKKSGIEGVLEGFGLGGVAGALTGRSRSQSRHRSGGGRRDRDDSRSRSRPRGDKKERQWAQAAQAAIVAGAVEAFRVRGEPGPWTGDKAKRIVTAAIGAGGIDALVDKDPNQKSKRHLVEAVLGGLAANRLANGPRDTANADTDGRGRSKSRSRSVMDRFRSKSRGRSGSSDRGGGDKKSGGTGNTIKDLAAGGALAAAGKAIYDRVRSKSQNRDRRSPSNSSEDSYVPSRSRRSRRDVGPPYSQQSRGNPDETAVAVPQQGRRRSIAKKGGGDGGEEERGGGGEKGGKAEEDTDSDSTTGMEEKRKKMRGKEFLTAGLASIATIHAAHSVYQSMEASDKRHKQVAEGEMSAEDAKKKRSKAWLQDAAAVGIAALGIKGAYSEWKEMNEQRHTVHELEEKRRKRQKRHETRMKEAGGGGGKGRYGGPPDRYGPVYADGNPYASGALPPPPMGPSNGRYDR